MRKRRLLSLLLSFLFLTFALRHLLKDYWKSRYLELHSISTILSSNQTVEKLRRNSNLSISGTAPVKKNIILTREPKEKLSRKSYIDLMELDKETKTFVKNMEKYPKTRRSFTPSELGDCINNGDADMKRLDKNCGCMVEHLDTGYVPECCKRHLLKLLKDVFSVMIKADLPFIMDGGNVIGWYRNRTLIPYDWDCDVALPIEMFYAPKFMDALKQLAD